MDGHYTVLGVGSSFHVCVIDLIDLLIVCESARGSRFGW
jgi:hypothetical protein